MPRHYDDWVTEAACNIDDSDKYFVAKTESTAEPKKICSTCPVRKECLSFALVNNLKYGVWGGMSYHERKAIPQFMKDDLIAQYDTAMIPLIPSPTPRLYSLTVGVQSVVQSSEDDSSPIVQTLTYQSSIEYQYPVGT